MNRFRVEMDDGSRYLVEADNGADCRARVERRLKAKLKDLRAVTKTEWDRTCLAILETDPLR